MKIGIFTFHCVANYGAVLQTYCLQEVLKGMGHEVYVIDYRPNYLIEPYKTFSYDPTSFDSFFAKCKGLLRACLVTPIRWKRNRVFSRFIDSHLNLYQLDLNDESNDFNAFVFGSDQIWNPKITGGFDKVYLGDFPAAKGKRLIAYAASAGSISNFAGENIDYFLSRLQCFDKVFVREKTLADYICKSISMVKVVLDPVLLAGRCVLGQLLAKQRRSSDRSSYLLLFQIGRNDKIAEYAAAISKVKKLKFIDVITVRESLLNNKFIKQTLSVEKLLEYFQNASYIVTSSFHGTVLSILFNKQFNTISIDNNTDERSLSILNKLHFSDRILCINDNLSSILIDYDEINVFCDKEKMDSYNLLNKSLLYH